jgi:hypothetical protein
MGNAKFFIGLIGLVINLNFFGYVCGLALTFAGLAVGIIIWFRYLKVKKLIRYGKQYENVYVVGRHPKTGKAPALGELSKIVIFAPHREVLTQIEKERRWLEKAGNKFFQSGKIDFIPIIYQDGVNVNEDFEEYGERAAEEIKADRAARHGSLKETGKGWYMKFSNEQRRSFEWRK